MRCSYCGSALHDVRTCPSTFQGSARRHALWCSYCGSKYHDVQACPKRHTGKAERDQGISIQDFWRR